MPTAHCVSTIDGVILEVDRAFLDLVGRSEADVVGSSYRSITHPEDLARSATMLASLVNREPPVRLQKRYVRPDGTVIAANVYVTRFDSPDRLVSTLFWNDRGRPLPPAKLWEAALRMRHMHRTREAELGRDLSTDPVGTLLTLLYLAEAEGRIIGLTDIAVQAGMSASIVVRWLRLLHDRGIVADLSDLDADVSLTRDGLAHMERILASAYDLPSVTDVPS